MLGETRHIYELLSSFLGEAKGGFDGVHMQLQFPCPKCIENEGEGEREKYNLEVNIRKGVYQCWKCSSSDIHMHGPLVRLIRDYGGRALAKDYCSTVEGLKEASMYSIPIIGSDGIDDGPLRLPKGCVPISSLSECPSTVSSYLINRGIDDKVVKEHDMMYILDGAEDKRLNNRVVIPSYDADGMLNYWTSRDITNGEKRQKYINPKVERKDIIFNESLVQWDADVTLVEGPFDHIVVPNSVPLLGKALTPSYKLYWELIGRCNAHVNIMLDGDAFEAASKVYKLLEGTDLSGRVRYIPMGGSEDPSSVFEQEGRGGIMRKLASATKIDEKVLEKLVF